MPYHTKEKKGMVKPKKKVVIKNGKKMGMSQNQKDKLKEHSKTHSSKHMAIMKKMMKGGASFTKAHNAAKKMVGK
jgi:predicted DNA-binding antitoxin AbrB/MazE fold protein